MENKRITTSELDFDNIKSNLKEFLRGQNEFTDYDFEGSAISVLLDILAYNTHYNALYTNLAVNESFLDSATKRNSVVSLAKNIGYVPHSAIAPTASLNIRVTNTSTSPATITIPKGTSFTTNVAGNVYYFKTIGESIAVRTAGEYYFPGVKVKEGDFLTFRYTVSAGQRYIIPNLDCDTTTLTVRVQDNSASATYTTFSLHEGILNIDGTSNVYFLKEIDNGLFEVEFGDGNLGKALSNGNVVTLEYMVTNKTAANGARLFTYEGDGFSGAGGSVIVSTASIAAGGADPEDIDSIKFNAPRAFSAQNRGVTVEDYKSLIYRELPSAQSVSVWGGEDHYPPTYGKVYLCIKPRNSVQLTQVEKNTIKRDILRSRNVVSIIPEIVDPKYVYLEVTTTAYFSDRLTTKTADDIKSIVVDTIKSYNSSELERFDGVFRHSHISRQIDAAEQSIISNITTVLLHVPVEPIYNANVAYKFKLGNPIFKPEILLRRPATHRQVSNDSVTSNGFYINGSTELHYIEDDGNGKLRLYYFTGDEIKVYVNNEVGTVDYTDGTVVIPVLNITSLNESEFLFTIKPDSFDVVSVRDQIVTIPDEYINVTVLLDNIAIGDQQGGLGYQFTTSRN